MILNFHLRPRRAITALALAGALVAPALVVGAPAGASTARIACVGAESQYADLISQIGGRDVSVQAILSNPSTDPHTYEVSTSVAGLIAGAALVVQNGAGYDAFMTQLEDASPSAQRHVVTVQTLLHLPLTTANPHLWYSLSNMRTTAAAIARALTTIRPSAKAYFATNLATFDASLTSLQSLVRATRAHLAGAGVAVSEPVADYLLSALGLDVKTPFRLQADVMNGIDPSPEDVATQDHLFTDHRVKVFCFNVQVSTPVTSATRTLAQHEHVPVVAVYETLPAHLDYQQWMRDEINAIAAAITHATSTEHLP